MTSTPVPITATVTPPALSAPRCAAASMPSARPLTTTTPARPSSSPSCSATASPYGDGLREPTIATRGPSGGGHRPRARSCASGGDILQPEAERLEHVVLLDLLRPVDIGGGAGHPPGPVKSASGHAALRRPALQSVPRWRRQAGQLSQARGLELRVERSLAQELPVPRADHTLPHAP